MAGTLKTGGNTIATHAGAGGAGTVTLDSSEAKRAEVKAKHPKPE